MPSEDPAPSHPGEPSMSARPPGAEAPANRERSDRPLRPVRIANCSGFYGDRLSALEEMVTGGAVDVVTGDYLAEVTMLVLARSRMRRPDGGYAGSFLRQLEPVAAEIAARGIKVVVNAGGLDPAGLATATRAMLEAVGVELEVAHVEGDDLSGRIPELVASGVQFENLETGQALSEWDHEVLTANAYLGGFGIKAALDAGADVVITGRVADASLASGSAAWWWDWSCEDYDRLAGAVVAGHIIECGAQATGGNFSGFSEIHDLRHPGFPLAEIDRDGTSVITKHARTGGAVSVDTVTAQLLYEVGGPGYLNPDVVARLDTVRLELLAPDRVAVTDVKGMPPPDTTKVAITGLGAWRNTTTVVLTGLDLEAKAELLEDSVRAHLDGDPGISDLRFTRIGTADLKARDQMAASCLLQIAVDGEQSSCGRAFSSFVVELALSNFPGIYYTEPPGAGSPFGVYWPALVPQSVVEHVVVDADGRIETVPSPFVDAGPDHRAPDGAGPREERHLLPTAPTPHDGHDDLLRDDAPDVEVPLGRIANARSGDKGGSANVGVWVRTPEAWHWLRSTLTEQRFKQLVPEASELTVERYELPRLRALNFVVHGLLDGGATEARRFDKQAKALGEWLRSRNVVAPASLLDQQPTR
jgi:hypothetical protein